MRRILPAMIGGLFLVACGGQDAPPPDDAAPPADVAPAPAPAATATAMVANAEGTSLGTLTLTETADGIHVTGTLEGLPAGDHGFHIHTTGQCAPPDFQSAGGHWNPTGKEHGSENPNGPHFGDMTNITVADDGTVSIDLTTPGGTLTGDSALLDSDGAAVMVHATADDYRTDPAGDAGARIACGVILAS